MAEYKHPHFLKKFDDPVFDNLNPPGALRRVLESIVVRCVAMSARLRSIIPCRRKIITPILAFSRFNGA